MSTQFDLEQSILDCWKITDELDLIRHNITEKGLTSMEVSNILLGMKHLYNLKFDQCFNQFEQFLKEKYNG